VKDNTGTLCSRSVRFYADPEPVIRSKSMNRSGSVSETDIFMSAYKRDLGLGKMGGENRLTIPTQTNS
jgi:hypothetical protein